MADLGEYALHAKELSRDEFQKKHPHVFLLQRLETEIEPEWAFKTTTVSRPTRLKTARLTAEGRRYRVLALVKATGNAWRERISVGRARNNDIVLTDGSVSKLHAYFVTEQGGDTTLVDAGSHNGTQVNGDPATANEPIQLKSGDTIIFGTVSVRFLESADLYDFVRGQLEGGP